MANRIQMQQRRGTAAEWANADPILLAGELGYDQTNNQFKIGDGISSWNSLPFVNIEGDEGPPGPQGDIGPAGPVGTSRQIAQISGRWYMEPDGRWQGFSAVYGAATENYAQGAGSGAEPTTAWFNQGPFCVAGTRIRGIRGMLRADDVLISGINLRLHFNKKPESGSWTSSSVVSQDVLASVDGFDLSDLGWHKLDLSVPSYVTPTDGFLAVFMQPTGTVSTRRYVFGPLAIEFDLPE